MPTLLTRAKTSDTVRFLHSKSVLAGLICAVLFVGAWAWHAHLRDNKNLQTGIASVTPVPTPCTAPAQSFCSSQAIFQRYIQTGDFSDVLQQQAPASGSSTGATTKVYALQQGGTIQYLTRNDYIRRLNEYYRENKPLRFTGDTSTPGAITMIFSSPHNASALSLKFQQDNTAWRLQYPVVQ